MSEALDYLDERALIDLCECPGLFAGQYTDLGRLPSHLVDRQYIGAAGLMGLARAYPTQAALDWYEDLSA